MPGPDIPNLSANPADEPPPTVKLSKVPEPTAEAPQVEEAQERYWTEDRVIRIGLMVLFAVFAVGLVVTLARWDVLYKVPFLPWLVGVALMAGPAWRAYSDHAEEAREQRRREAQAKTAFGVNVRNPRDRHQG